MLSRVAFWGVIITLQSDFNIWYPSPPFSSPLINEDLRAGPQLLFTFDNWFSSTGWAVSQSVRYIPAELLVCYQPHRQEVMPGQKSIYETFLSKTLQSFAKIYKFSFENCSDIFLNIRQVYVKLVEKPYS
jgi:hypothetical protein